MKIWVICSKRFYSKIKLIKEELEKKGHKVYLPNCYDAPEIEKMMEAKGKAFHSKFKKEMFERSAKTASKIDAALVLNFDKETKEGIYKNYVGGATFLEMYDVFKENKKIFMYNDIPKGILYDEINGFNPIIINKDLDKIK